MILNRKAIWEQVSPEDNELRIQKAFEMLLGEEFGLTSSDHLWTTIDQCYQENYNQVNEKNINVRRNCRNFKGIQKINSQVSMDEEAERL